MHVNDSTRRDTPPPAGGKFIHEMTDVELRYWVATKDYYAAQKAFFEAWDALEASQPQEAAEPQETQTAVSRPSRVPFLSVIDGGRNDA